MLRTFPGF